MLTAGFIVGLVGAACGACFVTWLVRYGALHWDWLDEPNHRSSHESPTPKSGGIGFIAALGIIWALTSWFIDGALPVYVIVLYFAALMVAIVGLIDDRVHLAPKLRLIFHFAAAAALVIFLPENLTVSGLAFLPEWALLAALVIAIVWFLNLFNFMDGIDGIASVEAASILFSAWLLALFFGEAGQLLSFLVLTTVAAIIGFLCLNWAPAKIFMGDVGSGFLGVLIPGLLMYLSIEADINFLSLLILTGVFVVDATVTLFRRFFDGQRVSHAHRSHGYQILSRRWQSHSRVSLLTLSLNLLWLLPFALASIVIDKVWVTWGLLIAAWLPLGIVAFRLEAGLKND